MKSVAEVQKLLGRYSESNAAEERQQSDGNVTMAESSGDKVCYLSWSMHFGVMGELQTNIVLAEQRKSQGKGASIVFVHHCR